MEAQYSENDGLNPVDRRCMPVFNVSPIGSTTEMPILHPVGDLSLIPFFQRRSYSCRLQNDQIRLPHIFRHRISFALRPIPGNLSYKIDHSSRAERRPAAGTKPDTRRDRWSIFPWHFWEKNRRIMP
jgi:hypothetical protein